ncbi:MAG TPA: glycosyltransferase 87 family protein [Gaiellaceae bacterium]
MSVLRAAAVGWVVLIAACSLPNVGLWDSHGKADTGLYSLYGGRIAHGHVPYRSGFSMEFPPGAIPALAVPALPRSHYVSWFKVFELLCAAAAIGAVAFALAGEPALRRYGAVVVAGIAPAALGPIVLNSFDFWPSALAAWAVALVVRGRPRWGLALLGAATAAKLYPVLLAPALLTYVARERGRDEARRALLAAAAVVFVVFAPFAVVAPGGLRASLQQQATRGLQVESLGGSVLGVAHRLGAGYHVVVSHSPFSFDVAGRGAGVLATLLTVLVLVATAAAWQLLRDGPVDRDRTLRAVAATAVGFVAFAKVLSPQYLLFLVPLVPLVDSLAAWAGLLLALALTQVWARFPEPFLQITHFGAVIWAALARNLVLVALYGLLLWGFRHRRATSSA